MFLYHEKSKKTELGNLVSRRVLAYGEEMMAVEVSFDKGGVGDPHAHPHTQTSYVVNGKFEVTVDGESSTLTSGDSFFVPSGKIHGVVCIEKGVLLDVFSPAREDFL